MNIDIVAKAYLKIIDRAKDICNCNLESSNSMYKYETSSDQEWLYIPSKLVVQVVKEIFGEQVEPSRVLGTYKSLGWIKVSQDSFSEVQRVEGKVVKVVSFKVRTIQVVEEMESELLEISKMLLKVVEKSQALEKRGTGRYYKILKRRVNINSSVFKEILGEIVGKEYLVLALKNLKALSYIDCEKIGFTKYLYDPELKKNRRFISVKLETLKVVESYAKGS